MKYDVLEVLHKADRNSADWWNNTLDTAKKAAELDRMNETYATDVYRKNAENNMWGKYSTIRGQDYDFALSPENVEARRGMADNAYQSPYARLQADAQSSGIADLEQRNRKALEVAQQFPGALGARATYGRHATDAGSFNIGTDIAAGNYAGANAQLERAGLGMAIEQSAIPGMVILKMANGQSMDLPPSEAARVILDRTGQKPGLMQTASDQREAEARKFDNQTYLKQLDIDQRNHRTDVRFTTEEGKRLVAELNAAQKTGDQKRVNKALQDIEAFKRKTAGATATPSGSVESLIDGFGPSTTYTPPGAR